MTLTQNLQTPNLRADRNPLAAEEGFGSFVGNLSIDRISDEVDDQLQLTLLPNDQLQRRLPQDR